MQYTSTEYAKKHFTAGERESLVPLLELHVEYLCRVLQSVSVMTERMELLEKAETYCGVCTCPEIAINHTCDCEIEPLNNPLGQEAAYYTKQGKQHGYCRSRRVRYLWIRLEELLSENIDLIGYLPYTKIELKVKEDFPVYCPVCGALFGKWRDDNCGHQEWEENGWCSHVVMCDQANSETQFDQCMYSGNEIEEFVRNYPAIREANDYDYMQNSTGLTTYYCIADDEREEFETKMQELSESLESEEDEY